MHAAPPVVQCGTHASAEKEQKYFFRGVIGQMRKAAPRCKLRYGIEGLV